jgi:hypothetical protein
MTDTPQHNRGHPSEEVMETQRQEARTKFRLGWVVVPLALLGMIYLLRHTSPAVTWEHVMDLLHVHNRERYTMLLHLCLALTGVVAAARILGRKDEK